LHVFTGDNQYIKKDLHERDMVYTANYEQILYYLLEKEPPPPKITPIIKFQKIEGDQIFFEKIGDVKVIWPGISVESENTDRIPLGQIPNENDLALREFPYVGNAKTMKFYPSYSYPARGTEVKHRRFFSSKDAALSEGFVASKLVK